MFICLDIETTGLSPEDDHIIEVAIVHFDHEKILSEWSSLIKPPVPIPEFVTRLTGITDEMVKDAPKLEDLADTIREKVGTEPIMGHFIFFDLNFLDAKKIPFQNQQLDTCQLTQVLLHNEASYSLEVLTEKLGISQPDAHRALADCKANIELFWQLSSHIKELPKDILPILEKSDWPWAAHIIPFLGQSGGKLIPQSKTEKVILSEKHADLTDLTQSLTTPFLFEEASHTYQDLIDYATNLDDNSLLVVPNTAQLPEHNNLGIIKDPSEYIDEERLENYLSSETLDTPQTMLGIKAKLWLQYSKTGEKSEIKLFKEENLAWQNICCTEPKSFSKKVTAIDHTYFLTDRSRKEPRLKAPKHLVLGQTEQLVKEIEFAWRITFSEDRFTSKELADKISILFGLLGMVYQKHSDADSPFYTFNIEPFHRTTPEWKKVIASAESIASISSDPYLTYLSKILSAPNSILWITLNQNGDPLLHSFPENPSQLFSERVWPGIENLHLFCHHGNIDDDFQFIKSELGLPELTTHSTQDILPLPLVKPKTKISSPNNPSNIKEVAHELSLHIPDITGNIFLLVTSKKSAEQFFYALKTNRNLFVQNLNGGLGKIYKMSQKTDGNNIFVGNEFLLNFLLSEGTELSFLAVHRLPFSPPNSPTQKARAKAYTDAYKEFSLPQACLRFRGNLNLFLGNKWEGKNVLVLDPRNTEYEKLLY